MSLPRIAGLIIVLAWVQAAGAASSALTADQLKVLEQVRRYAVAYTQGLPNFVCTQVTSREITLPSGAYREQMGAGAEFGPSDQIIEKVTFFNRKEEYEVVAVNGKKVSGARHDQLSGAVSIGEFGSALLEIFNPNSHTAFNWDRMTSVRGRRVYVFGFQVPKDAGILVSDRTTNQKIVASFSGLIFADAETKQVLRISSHIGLPAGFPIDLAERMVEYKSEKIAGKDYNLPFHSEVKMQRGVYLFVNKIDFKDYRKFTAETTIRLGDVAELESPEANRAANAPPSSNEHPDQALPPEAAQITKPDNSEAGASALSGNAVTSPEPAEVSAQPATAEPAQASPIESRQADAPAPTDAARSVNPSSSASTPEAAPDSSPDSSFRLKLSANLVLVPVVVRDAKGNSIGNLQQESFSIFDKGKREQIATFTVETQNVQTPGSDASPKSQQDAKERAAAAGDSRTSYTVFFFDDAHIEHGELISARDAVIHQIQDLAATDRAAIITTSGLVQVSFTNDREKLKDALMKLRFQPMGNETEKCPTITYYSADLILRGSREAIASATQELILCQSLSPEQAVVAPHMVTEAAMRVAAAGERRTRSALLQLNNVIRWISKAPGKRQIILISSGFVVADRARTDESDLIELAIRSQVLINALDTNGVSAATGVGDVADRSFGPTVGRIKENIESAEMIATSSVLGEIAEGTGGSLVRNTNDLYDGLRHLETEPEYTYLLGFKPAHMKPDGSFHSLTVKVNTKEKVDVHVRRGYYAPKE